MLSSTRNLDSVKSDESQENLFVKQNTPLQPEYLQELSKKNNKMQNDIQDMMLLIQIDPFSKEKVQKLS